MDNIFTLRDDEINGSTIDMDDLYQRKQELDSKKLNTYNKVLGRIHNRIKLTSRQRNTEQFCWYVVPEILIGISQYDHTECCKFLMDQLRSNGFEVAYTHPNLILVSWANWVPGYVRHEIKKQTGVRVDGYGKVVDKKKQSNDDFDPNSHMIKLSRNRSEFTDNVSDNVSDKVSDNVSDNVSDKYKDANKYKDVNSYTPSRKSIYSVDLFPTTK